MQRQREVGNQHAGSDGLQQSGNMAQCP
jgi:hypothetical protein